jgi:subtilisin family serine protease
VAPAICPDCTLLVRPIFAKGTPSDAQMPSATPSELAAAIVDCIDASVRLINLSVALAQPSLKEEQELREALDYAMEHGAIAVAAAGNQGTLGSTVITRHPSVIPVVAYDLRGRPMDQSNGGGSIGRRGLGAPGDAITSVAARGGSLTFSGTSAAAPFVTGALALIWSELPSAAAPELRLAITHAPRAPRRTVIPPLLDAWAAYQAMRAVRGKE